LFFIDQANNTIDKLKTILKGKLLRQPLVMLLFALVVIAALVITSLARSSDQLQVQHRILMDTAIEIRYLPPIKEEYNDLAESVFEEMERLEYIFSRSYPDSEISRVNLRAGIAPVAASGEVLHVIEQAISYSVLSNGAFDPTIAPLVDLWGFHGQEYRLPDPEEIKETLKYINYLSVNIDRENSEIFLPERNMALELGGIAKGYIVDSALEVMRRKGVTSAFINAGGDIGLIGTRPDGSAWRIGVRHPVDENKVIAVIPAAGGAVVTSGNYERTFEVDGVNYHHLLDPSSGYPANELSSATIVASTALAADALSTAVFVMGPVKGMQLIEELPGVEGILITVDLQVLVSSGLADQVELNL